MFFHSPNYKLLASRDQSHLYLYRERALLWKKELSTPSDAVLGVGNNGLVLVSTPQGLSLHFATPNDPPSPIKLYQTALLAQQGAQLGKVILDGAGEAIVLEKQTVSARGSHFPFGFGSGKKEEQSHILELIRYDISRGSEEQICQVPFDKNQGRFLWDVTRDLAYMVTAEERQKTFPGKGLATKVALHSPRSGATLYSFSIPAVRIRQLFLSIHGTLVLSFDDQNEIQLMGVEPDAKKFFVTVPREAPHIAFVGRQFVAVEDTINQVMHLIDFNDKPILSMNFQEVKEEGRGLSILFRPNDDVLLVEANLLGEPLQLTYVPLSQLETEYKRWQNEAKQAKEQVVLQQRRLKEDEKRKQQDKERSKRTEEALAQSVLLEQTSTGSGTPRKLEILKNLEHLKLQMVTGAISQEEGGKRKEALQSELDALSMDSEKEAPKMATPETEKAASSNSPSSNSLSGVDDSASPAKLLELLEERFIRGEISEDVYLELRDKYKKKKKRKKVK